MEQVTKNTARTLREKLAVFLDFLFPRKAEVRQLETMSVADLVSVAPRPHDQLQNIMSLFRYKDPLISNALWEVKYRKNKKIARLLAEAIHEQLVAELSERSIFDNFTKPLLVPIPASRERMRKFGYNQCELIAKFICEVDAGAHFAFADPLIKFKDTPSQTAQHDRVNREENIKNAFEIKAVELVKDRNIILLDDVATTGSTLREAMRVLAIAGAKKILAVTVAH